MKKNMGKIDKRVRYILAVVFAVLYATDIIPGVWGIVLVVLSGVFILTSTVSFCPLYLPFKINTAKKPKTE